MKHGDQVKTPAGLGIFFALHDDQKDKAYIVLKNPVDGKVFIPVVEPGKPIWDCFPCNLFGLSDIIMDKTLEQRQAEAQAAANAARAQQEYELKEKMRQFQEAQKRTHEQATQNQTGTI